MSHKKAPRFGVVRQEQAVCRDALDPVFDCKRSLVLKLAVHRRVVGKEPGSRQRGPGAEEGPKLLGQRIRLLKKARWRLRGRRQRPLKTKCPTEEHARALGPRARHPVRAPVFVGVAPGCALQLGFALSNVAGFRDEETSDEPQTQREAVAA